MPPGWLWRCGDWACQRWWEKSRCGHLGQELMGPEPAHIGAGEGSTQASGSRREQRPKLLGVTPQRSEELASQAGPCSRGTVPPEAGDSRTRREEPAEDPPTRTRGRSAGSHQPARGAAEEEAPRDLQAEQVGVAATRARLGQEWGAGGDQSCWLCPRNQEGNRVTGGPGGGFSALSHCLLRRLEGS